MVIKIIKTEADYEAAHAAIEELINQDPEPGTREAERLELLTILVEDYEEKHFPHDLPGPIEAIRFRMEQEGLIQRDLVPYMGSPSKVSEVLSGKRRLSLSMIRALHIGLGIPAEVLLQERHQATDEHNAAEWERFPLKEMTARGWLNTTLERAKAQPKKWLRDFFAPLGSPMSVAALYRKTDHVRSGRKMDRYALAAWSARVMNRALESPPSSPYEPGTVTPDFMQEIVQLSWSDRGPILAQEFLNKHGISLVIEPHLPRTHLDGAALLVETDRPVVGLTLRYDRVDNFWFCLMHELAHVALHLDEKLAHFYDDLDVENPGDSQEAEADELAGETLIPEAEWRRSPASRLRTPEAAEHLAKRLRIHPAIVAGRIRHKFEGYQVLSDLVGQGEVRQLFTDVEWS